MAMEYRIKCRIKSEQTMVRITNDDLMCKDCLLRYPDNVIFGNTSKCEVFPESKPNGILMGGTCSEYLKE